MRGDIEMAVLIACIFISFWICDGDPDLLDSLIIWLTK